MNRTPKIDQLVVFVDETGQAGEFPVYGPIRRISTTPGVADQIVLIETVWGNGDINVNLSSLRHNGVTWTCYDNEDDEVKNARLFAEHKKCDMDVQNGQWHCHEHDLFNVTF